MKNEVKDEKLEEMLTELDPPYESKEELKIGRLLDQYGIPFFYKQSTIVYDQGRNEIWKPTFTLYPYGGLVIDYVPDSGQEPENRILQRRQVYNNNQIPAVVLGINDLGNPNWQQMLYEKLEKSYRQHAAETGYTVPQVQQAYAGHRL